MHTTKERKTQTHNIERKLFREKRTITEIQQL